jgi:hypothetical protein
MLEVPYALGESVEEVFERAGQLARERWGNLAEFSVQVQPGEQLARVRLTGHVMSVRWDVASGNVAAFIRRCHVMAATQWGPMAKVEIFIREDGYADIIFLGR